MPTLSATTWRDRSTRIIRQGAVARQSTNRSRQLITGKGVAPRHRFEIKMGPNLVRARMAWPVGCGGEYGSLERRRARTSQKGAGPCAAESCEPRQVRKEATVSRLVWVPQDHLAPLLFGARETFRL